MQNLNSTFFINASIGWAVGKFGTIVHTFDGGASWSTQTSGTTQNLLFVQFTDASNGWAAGTSGTILETGTNLPPTAVTLSPGMEESVASDSVALRWRKGSANVTGYQIEISSDSSFKKKCDRFYTA